MLLSQHQVTGLALIAAFVLFAIGGTLPVVGVKGNPRIFTLPVREHLRAVADNAVVWRVANVFMGAAAVVLLAGLGRLTTSLDAANERVFSRLGLVGWLVATVLWMVFSAFRAVVTTRAAHELVVQGSTAVVPAHYQRHGWWGSAVFTAYAVVGYLALSSYGASLLQLTYLPPWVGWATLVSGIALLIHLLITGDTLPAYHYMPPLLIGLLLLLRP